MSYYFNNLQFKKLNTKFLLSVHVITYGHEKYIRKALDSILMQEVNFDYEIIVGEDCSPDGTRTILKEYSEKYPDKFTMIYRESNIGGRENSYDLFNRCQGKYIAVLEGDDYWLDKDKLQKQVDFLEGNEKYIATTHKVVVVDEFDKPKKITYPSYKASVYTIKQYKKGLLPGQFGTIVMRNIFKYGCMDLSFMIKKDITPLDQVNAMILSSIGPVYRFDEVMSSYRHVTSSGTSYSANKKKKTPIQMYNFWAELLHFSRQQTENKEMIEYLEKKEMYSVFRCIGKLPTKEIKKYIRNNFHNKKAIRYSIFKLFFLPIEKLNSMIKRRLKGDF